VRVSNMLLIPFVSMAKRQRSSASDESPRRPRLIRSEAQTYRHFSPLGSDDDARGGLHQRFFHPFYVPRDAMLSPRADAWAFIFLSSAAIVGSLSEATDTGYRSAAENAALSSSGVSLLGRVHGAEPGGRDRVQVRPRTGRHDALHPIFGQEQPDARARIVDNGCVSVAALGKPGAAAGGLHGRRPGGDVERQPLLQHVDVLLVGLLFVRRAAQGVRIGHGKHHNGSEFPGWDDALALVAVKKGGCSEDPRSVMGRIRTKYLSVHHLGSVRKRRQEQRRQDQGQRHGLYRDRRQGWQPGQEQGGRRQQSRQGQEGDRPGISQGR